MYTCPMHPEIRQEGPGSCPKCGMALVDEGSIAKKDTASTYAPLIIVLALIAAVAATSTFADGFSWRSFIERFMAGFFVAFGGFKLLDLRGFVDGYASYDLLAKRFRPYAFAYPFIELGFGLAMVAGVMHPALLWTEFAIMVFGGAGVAVKLARREKFQCVCLGSLLKAPLSSVTLVEDFGMAAMALSLILLR